MATERNEAMASEEKFLALVAFVQDNKNGLVPVKNLETAKSVILELMKLKMTPAAIVRRICVSHHATVLLTFLADQYKGRPLWKDFMDSVLTLKETRWNDNRLLSTVVSTIFASPQDIEHIIQNHQHLLEESEHPLSGCFSTDLYWLDRVRRYIATEDFRRAWDELKKARRGFLFLKKVDLVQFLLDFALNGEHPKGEAAASMPTVTTLIHELYAAMADQGLLPTMSDAEYPLQSELTRTMSYEIKPSRDNRKPRQYKQSRVVAGFGFAKEFLVRENLQAREHIEPRYIFKPEGGMILKLAEYFRLKKEGARRQKHEQAVEQYRRERRQQDQQ